MLSCSLQSEGEGSLKNGIRSSMKEHYCSKTSQVIIKVGGSIIILQLGDFEVTKKQCLHNLIIEWQFITNPIIWG